MTRAENWQLVLRVCAESQDEVIASLRIALLNDFGKTDAYGKGDNFKQLFASLKAFQPLRRKASLCQPPRGKAMILFPGASGSNLLNLLPVAEEARRQGVLGGIVAGENFQTVKSAALDGFDNVVSENSLRSLAGAGFLPGSLLRAGRRLQRLIKMIARHNPHCAKRVRQNYGSYVRLMLLSEGMGLAYQKLLAHWRPSVILSTSDFWPAEFQCCWQARKLGIPTAILQHGVINDMCVWPTYHDFFLAWGDSFRDQLLGHGATNDRVRVLGMPGSDNLFTRAKHTEDKLDQAPVCLILSHTQDRVEEAALFEEFGQCLIEAIRSMPAVKWMIRLHPSEDDSFYRERGISSLAGVEIVRREISLEQSVDEASVVCTIRSTAGMQAMMLQKPLLVLDLAALSSPPVAWPAQGGGLYVKTAEEIKKVLGQLSADKTFARSLLASQDAFLNKTFASRGKAAVAITNFLKESVKISDPNN